MPWAAPARADVDACTGNEKIKKIKCKSGVLKVVTVGANANDLVTVSTNAVCGSQVMSKNASNGGKAKFKFTGCVIGPLIIDVSWGCGIVLIGTGNCI